MGSVEVALSGAIVEGCPALDFIGGGKWCGCSLQDLDGCDLRFIRSRASSPHVRGQVGSILQARYRACHRKMKPRRTSGYRR